MARVASVNYRLDGRKVGIAVQIFRPSVTGEARNGTEARAVEYFQLGDLRFCEVKTSSSVAGLGCQYCLCEDTNSAGTCSPETRGDASDEMEVLFPRSLKLAEPFPGASFFMKGNSENANPALLWSVDGFPCEGQTDLRPEVRKAANQ